VKRGQRQQLAKEGPEDAEERRKASVLAGVEHPIRGLKRCFKCSKLRYRGCTRNGGAWRRCLASRI